MSLMLDCCSQMTHFMVADHGRVERDYLVDQLVGSCLCIANKIAILWRSKAPSFLYNSGLAWFPIPLLAPPWALIFNLTVEGEEEKRLSSVQGDSFDLRHLAFSSCIVSLCFYPSKRLFLTLECIMLLAAWASELSLIFLPPKQAATNSLTSVIFLGFPAS